MAEATEQSVVAQALGGDGDAFRSLVDQHSRALFGLAYRMTGNRNDAEDVVQETFLRAYRNLRRFDSRASFSTWLHSIATNCALDLLRSRRREAARHAEARTLWESDSAAAAQERHLFSSEINDHIRLALDELSASERTAFVLRHFEGRSAEEIGRVLNLKANAAKHTVFRAVRKLRRALGPMVKATS